MNQFSHADRDAGIAFVTDAAGKTGGEIQKEIADLDSKALAGLISYLEWRYDGAIQGFAGTLHSICTLEAGKRFVVMVKGGVK